MSTGSVTVLLFASYADACGRTAVEVPVSVRATAGDIVAQIRSVCASVVLPDHPAVAVNREYVSYDHLIMAGDEVALIPPVAGG